MSDHYTYPLTYGHNEQSHSRLQQLQQYTSKLINRNEMSTTASSAHTTPITGKTTSATTTAPVSSNILEQTSSKAQGLTNELLRNPSKSTTLVNTVTLGLVTSIALVCYITTKRYTF